MDEKGNGKKGKGSEIVSAKMENLLAMEPAGSGKIFLTFDVKFFHGNMEYSRSFAAWIPAPIIQRAVVLPPNFTEGG